MTFEGALVRVVVVTYVVLRRTTGHHRTLISSHHLMPGETRQTSIGRPGHKPELQANAAVN